MTKGELFKLIRQEKKDRSIVITWVDSKTNQIIAKRPCDVKISLMNNRIEFLIGEY